VKESEYLLHLDVRLSINLISRVFSLLRFEDAEINADEVSTKNIDSLPRVDYDISSFCTYVEHFKLIWRSNLESILYRAFRCGRASLDECLNAKS